MSEFGSRRVMWLLNHKAARKFEIPMLKRIGFREFFLPKIFPNQVGFRSSDVDFSEDAGLTIPSEVLEHFNSLDWYAEQPRSVWELASRYFDVAFFICENAAATTGLVRKFTGAAIWRAYGLDKSLSYTSLAQRDPDLSPAIVASRRRFWLGQAYPNTAEVEEPFLKRRSIYLPLGMPDVSMKDAWSGGDRRILFVCPDLGFNPYYRDVYEGFKRHFGDLPYVVGGSQAVAVHDTKVLGFLSAEDYARNMRELRVMYYHSKEPRHIHYHPFEAVRAGMPLIFKAGGMLDQLGGSSLPGRCRTDWEARSKIKRILDGDRRFTESVRQSQTRLLDAMSFESMVPQWQRAMSEILGALDESRRYTPPVSRRRRVAVLLPVKYRGGSLRGAKLLAQALRIGGRTAGEDVDVVLGHLDDAKLYTEADFADLGPGITVRPYSWRHIDRSTAARAMVYDGKSPVLKHDYYSVPDDGIQHFADCDLWVIVSDRIECPLLPLRPSVLMVYDYQQRYVPLFEPGQDEVFLDAARQAKRVLVTTEFTARDAVGYAGVPAGSISKVPMLVPQVRAAPEAQAGLTAPYFLWSTNMAPHKNHLTAIKALLTYYEELNGQLDCVVTGVNSRGLLSRGNKNVLEVAQMIANTQTLKSRLKMLGELPESRYAAVLKSARFYWHPTIIDNGTFSVVEAARLGVPSLSSDYPAMREMDAQFELNLAYAPSQDPDAIAARLRWMEDNVEQRRRLLPEEELFERNSVDRLAGAYWQAVGDLL